MKFLNEIFQQSGNLHHAYLLEGEKNAIRENLLAFIETALKHPVHGNPDFWHGQFETFAIEDARRLRDMQALKPLVYPRKIFVLEVLSMTVEAQNALLKIFEEPTPGTHFFLIISSADSVLPTLRSRMVTVAHSERNHAGKVLLKRFLQSTIPERLELVKDIVEEKDKAKAHEFVDGIIVELGKKPEAYASILKELLELRSYLSQRSPSLKLILEHISLILPTI